MICEVVTVRSNLGERSATSEPHILCYVF